jgi:hypothetical protein
MFFPFRNHIPANLIITGKRAINSLTVKKKKSAVFKKHNTGNTCRSVCRLFPYVKG